MDCPNCITEWKCNGPHLLKIDESHYKCDYGYFFVKIKYPNIKTWGFMPNERVFETSDLVEVTSVLNYLNKQSLFAADIDDLTRLAQLLKNEEGKNDIDGVADTMLEILGDIKRGKPLGTIERMI